MIKSMIKSGIKPEITSWIKSMIKSEIKSVIKSMVKPGIKSDFQSRTKPGFKCVLKSGNKSCEWCLKPTPGSSSRSSSGSNDRSKPDRCSGSSLGPNCGRSPGSNRRSSPGSSFGSTLGTPAVTTLRCHSLKAFLPQSSQQVWLRVDHGICLNVAHALWSPALGQVRNQVRDEIEEHKL